MYCPKKDAIKKLAQFLRNFPLTLTEPWLPNVKR